MSENLFMVNQVIHDNPENRDYRILWLPASGKGTAYWFSLSGKTSISSPVAIEDLETGVSEGRYSFAPDLWHPVPGGSAGETALRLRDKAWELIQDAVNREPDIYIPKQRAAILREISASSGTDTANLYKLLGKYWRYGKVPDAFLPDYSTCGKTRDPYKDASGRPGRRKAPGAPGKKLTVKDLHNFRAAITKYYLSDEKLSLEKTYQKLIGDYYTIRDAQGKAVAPMNPDEVPSRQQFYYWHRKNRDTLEEVRSRNGDRSYSLNNRGETGRTETHLYGPGMACQIDATTADIYLVSRDDRSAIIGRPTMYFQMDSFSHMVTGMNISLDPPSWENAARTILNSVENKVDYCKKYGITIPEEDWPCMHFPSVILADRGEMESRTADILCKSLGITIENTPPYRGDLKGIIEKHFDLINIDMASLPGKVEKDSGQRCTKDYRLEAALDLNEFTAIIIRCVLQYNNYHYMENFRKTAQMRQLHVMPVPRDIWNFGIRYMSGGLKTMDRSYVRYHLLPRKEASVTPYGIRFDNRYYTCAQAEEEKWFDCARTGSSWKLTVSYDPRDASVIYISPAANRPPAECHLLEKDQIYEGTSAEEARRMAQADHGEHEAYRQTEDFHRVQLNDFIEETKEKARAKQPEKSRKSKAARIAEIDQNRRKEKDSLKSHGSEEDRQKPEPAPSSSGSSNASEEQLTPVTKMIRDALYKVIGKGEADDHGSTGSLPE